MAMFQVRARVSNPADRSRFFEENFWVDIGCDLCTGPRLSAEIRCDKHRWDLCVSHLRRHFGPGKCRLVPVKREATASEQLSEKVSATLRKLRKQLDAGRRNGKKRHK